MASNEPSVVLDSYAEQVKVQFYEFLDKFCSISEEDEEYDHMQDFGRPNRNRQHGPVRRDYVDQANQMRHDDRTTLLVDFRHLLSFNQVLAESIEEQYYRFEPYLRKALQNFMRKLHPTFVADENGDKEFWLCFYNIPAIQKIRALRTEKVGQLLSICGTVTRTSEVRPELLYGSFRCLLCDAIQDDVEQQFKYTEPLYCKNSACSNKTSWQLMIERSKFVDWQRIRVQENANEIPSGAMPRSIDIIARNDIVERAKAGDRCVFTGCLIAIPDVSQYNNPGRAQAVSQGDRNFAFEGVRGLSGLGVRDLTYKLCFLANNIQPPALLAATAAATSSHPVWKWHWQQIDGSEETTMEQFSEEDKEEIQRIKEEPGLYGKLVKCIAPSAWGHDEVKRGILLMLFGGVHKDTTDGIKLRGDINVCIVGDPSTSKSQFLKWVVAFLPRAIYTSGKASSAAGLTATVAKDPDSGDFNIEAGALLLADNGICCIDEFDKMDVKDQVAIHEAMEQQTISIAKAGVQANLNARASILAAANPIGGRYDKSKTLKANLNITPAIMSRFDLFFVVLDDCDAVTDLNIARHIVSLHQKREQALVPPLSTAQLQKYIKYAKTLKPTLSEEAKQLLVKHYRVLRQNDAGMAGRTSYRITVRQLESMIRLSEALARLHCDELVRPEYVEEAARLLRKSIIHVETEDVVLGEAPTSLKSARVNMTTSKVDEGDDEEIAQKENSPVPNNTPKGKVDKLKDAPAAAGKQSKVVSISFEKYQKVANLLALHLRKQEEEHPDESGTRQGDLVRWYLAQCDEIANEEQLHEEARIVRNVIQRLVTKDHVFLDVTSKPTSGKPTAKDLDNRLLIVHPNYDPTGL